MKTYRVTITARTYWDGKKSVPYPDNGSLTATVTVFADNERQARARANNKYMLFPGYDAEIISIVEVGTP